MENNEAIKNIEFSRCIHELRLVEPEPCPYAEEVNNEIVLCDCCEQCRDNCADDI